MQWRRQDFSVGPIIAWRLLKPLSLINVFQSDPGYVPVADLPEENCR